MVHREKIEHTPRIGRRITYPDAYMDAAREDCTRLGVTVCDAYARWKKLQQAGVDTTTLLSNRINHPDRQMHALFADCLLEGRLYAD